MVHLGDLPYRVTVMDGDVNITPYVVSIDSIKFQGSGKIRTGSITLDATDGAFVTNEDYLGDGKTPILNQFDRIKIELEDNNSNMRNIILEIDQEMGQKNINGKLLPIELKGRERSLQDIKFTAFYQFKTPRYVIEDIVARYNRNKGTAQPTIYTEIAGNNTIIVPDNIVNIYDFTNEISYYDALMHVINRLNQPTPSGGSGDFYSLTFWDGEVSQFVFPSVTGLVLNVRIQGEGRAATPEEPLGRVLQSTAENPFRSLTYQRHSQAGTQVLVRGAPNSGHLPSEFHKYQSAVEELNHLPTYAQGEIYTQGIICRGSDNFLYRADARIEAGNPPPGTNWTRITPADFIGTLDYSPWTKEKSLHTKNSMGNPTRAFKTQGYSSPAFPDGNLVIREGSGTAEFFAFFRDFAMVRATSFSQIPNEYLPTPSSVYQGFRVLVNGVATGNWAGNDKFGRSRNNALIIYDGNDWIVIRNPQVGDQVCILSEARTYEWNTPWVDRQVFGGAARENKGKVRNSWQASQEQIRTNKYRGSEQGALSWLDVSAEAGGNDAFHHPTNVSSVDGLFPSMIHGDNYTYYTRNSALRIQYDFNLTGVIHDWFVKMWEGVSDFVGTVVDILFNGFDDFFNPTSDEQEIFRNVEYYDFGWWYALPFPYPFSTYNGISENLGDFYGKVFPSTRDRNLIRDGGVLDLQNANYTRSGNTGFNNAEISDLGGPFNAIRFYFNFDIRVANQRKPFVGNVPFTVTIYDDLSQVWRSDFTYRFLGETQEIEIPFSSFTVNRPSRTPWGFSTLFSNIVVPELEIRSIFEQKRIRLITIQLNDSYDDHLRYLPIKIENIIATIFGLGQVQFIGIIDGLTLTKQPFAHSGVEAERVINPPTVQATNVRNIRQLESIAIAYKDLYSLQHEEYTLVMDADCIGIEEEYVVLKDPDLIRYSESGENTRRLILMVDDYSYNANGQKSGLMMERTLIRRLPRT